MSSIMTVRAPEELQSELKQIAAKRGFTRNALILQILQEWLERKQKEKGHEENLASQIGTRE